MYRNERTRNIILIVLAVCLIGITVAYATLSQNLNISGVANVDKTSWNIHFTNVLTPKVEGQATGGKAVLNDGKTVLTISEGTLSAPGDKIIYTFDVINEGDLPAEVETTLTQMESCKAENGSDVSIFCNRIGLDLMYKDTSEKVQKEDRLLSGETKTLNLVITYDKDRELTSLPTSPIILSNITSTINYTMLTKEKSEIPLPEKKAICKRATELHANNSVTYGNLGASGTLTSGDAFDCDVNGDGTYDSSTERFYYVSDYYDTDTKLFDSTTAVLIYYNHVSGGVQNKNNAYSYDSSGENFHGPRTAMQQLPTTKQWSNIKLKKLKRSILNQNGENATGGGTLPSEFSYEGYAARLLTTQEVNAGCNVTIGSFQNNELDFCNYLFENTDVKGGYWLETPTLSSSLAYEISGGFRRLAQDSVTYWGSAVRPVIEVSKSDIEY